MRPSRPRIVVLVTGTGTEVGKTWVSCELLRMARARGLTVAARKPAQSFAPGDPPEGTDAFLLGGASGEPPSGVCPDERSYPVAMAPPMAAEVLGLPVPSIRSLAGEVTASWPEARCDLGLVEGAGGLASPLAGDGDSADLARLLDVDQVVVVADAGLGVIHSCRLAVRALPGLPAVVHLNRFDPGDELHRRNCDWLRRRDGLAVTTDVGDLLDRVTGGAVTPGGGPGRCG